MKNTYLEEEDSIFYYMWVRMRLMRLSLNLDNRNKRNSAEERRLKKGEGCGTLL